MATAVIMPRQGQSVESCIIGEWHVKKGDKVSVDDLLFTYETDKATFDEKAKVEGEVLDVYFDEGDDVPCLTNVCVIGQPGEDPSEFNPHQQDPEESKTALAEDKEPSSGTGSSAAKDESDSAQEAAKQPVSAGQPLSGEVPAAISPRARHLSERTGADLRHVQASGPKDRVIERDVRRLIEEGKIATRAVGSYPADLSGTGIGGRVTTSDAAGAAANQAQSRSDEETAASQPETYTEKHSRIRKLIASSMHKSLSEMAQLTLNSSFDASDMMQLRKRLKSAQEQGLSSEQGFDLAEKVPTVNDLILFAVSRVISRYPACNAWYDDEKMTYFHDVNLGVAVDTQRGLMVPTVFAAQKLKLRELSVQVKDAAKACQEGTISPDQLKGGTFTVTNLGTLGVESFTPVINPPQTCILGVCGIVDRVKDNKGEVEVYPSIGLSLTFDHRALDGAPAAKFLKDLKHTLENISLFLMHG